ncbi:hypothetical protein [Prevotella sp. KH2C16]|uniref:hypothetical protein n=1 Tax=Prevotella sp. KH2C16 TaxID=1855325 RepID=UPI001160AED4|nr:hypothetical protein [Prevotella sp. KH2C16]
MHLKIRAYRCQTKRKMLHASCQPPIFAQAEAYGRNFTNKPVSHRSYRRLPTMGGLTSDSLKVDRLQYS